MSVPDSVRLQAVRISLLFFGVASVVLIAGFSSLLLAMRRSRDRLMLWVGAFSILYAIRLFAQNGLVRAASGGSEQGFQLCSLCLTYVIPIPFALFARELVGPGWKRSISAWLWIEIAFAVTAIPLTLWGQWWNPTSQTNSILIIAGTLLLLAHVIVRPRTANEFTKSLMWPLIVFGVLVLFNNLRFLPAGINIEPLGFLVLLGGLGFTASSLTIRRERKLVEVEQELATARRIQSSIIPDVPLQIPGVSIATRYEPMTSVAGDFFGFLKTSETSLSILVADVSGHGVPAALVASMLKVCFTAQEKQANDPAKVLAGLNFMLRGSLGGQYVTAACAAIDLTAHTLTYAGAGHPPGLLLRKNKGDVIQLAENGLFIGPFPHATYTSMTVAFRTGDKLLLYTDGIVEASGSDGEEFGMKNLERLLLETGPLDASQFVEELFLRISSPTQQDDLTVVLTQCS